MSVLVGREFRFSREQFEQVSGDAHEMLVAREGCGSRGLMFIEGGKGEGVGPEV